MPADRASSKHGPQLDEEMTHEVEGYVRGGRDSRAEEWRSAEPAPDNEPLPPEDLDRGSAPPGMTRRDVEERSELAQWLGRGVFPAKRDDLLDRLREENAPDHVLAEVSAAPSGVEFDNLGDLWRVLHGGEHVESRRY